MKTKPSNQNSTSGVAIAEDRSVASKNPICCDAALWIGDTRHAEFASLWRACQSSCDTIAVRPSIEAAIAQPPRGEVSHVIVAQTNRHDSACLAVDTWVTGRQVQDHPVSRLRALFPNARLRVVRGPLVAPSVLLPNATAAGPSNSDASSLWIETIRVEEATADLTNWLSCRSELDDVAELGELPGLLIVVSAEYSTAETIFDAITAQLTASGGSRPAMSWRRSIVPDPYRPPATILWDDSIAKAGSVDQWQARLAVAPACRHVWMTGDATTNQRQVAMEGGIHLVIEKPGRLNNLLAAVAAA